ncbi:hypothetical protein C0W42_18570 [Photobacterium kishitanii]|uniref:hypothetical protein n=1 Tax=Photobacterium kishitanii TaxID=318456 RepID=UPI000D1517FC|nr:hypothetical protein [Photobacterium kishitanii]PSU86968.1 hypothetical protein C0W42_18570 [Photobacterium kishitanii]
MEVRNEILNDYREHCYSKLVNEFGVNKVEEADAIYLYQRFKCRIIPQKERVVFEALGFEIPEEYFSAYTNIKVDIQGGSDLKKYQSRKLKNLDYDDDMLSHWGIQHFHLGLNLEKDDYVSRTGELLFVYFSDSSAHILGLFSHGSWCDIDLIEIIHRNWPEKMTIYALNRGMQSLTETDYKTLRKTNANANIVVQDGTEYIYPGMGVVASGGSVKAVINSSKLVYLFDGYFERISQSIDEILNHSPESKELPVITIGLELSNQLRDFVFIVKETGFRFRIPS